MIMARHHLSLQLESHMDAVLGAVTRGAADADLTVASYAVQALTDLIEPMFADNDQLLSLLHQQV